VCTLLPVESGESSFGSFENGDPLSPADCLVHAVLLLAGAPNAQLSCERVK